MSGYTARFHKPTIETEPFWEGCERGEFRLQTCESCERTVFYPRLICPHCGSTALRWSTARGEGTIYSFSHVFVPFGETWKTQVPYTSVLVDLPEGVRIVSRLIGPGREDVKVGDKVKFVFVEASGRKLPFVERMPA